MPSLNVVVVTLEFTYAPFSGNGILARSLVKSLLQQDCQVTVWCCRPQRHDLYASDHHLDSPEISKEQASRLNMIVTTIPERFGWKRLDKDSPWRQFYFSNVDLSDEVPFLTAVSAADVVCPIDWTGSLAWSSVASKLSTVPPVLYLNFRVFSLGIADPGERDWYVEKEIEAVQQARMIVALSEKDKGVLSQFMKGQIIPIHVLLPPLREDVKQLASFDYKDLKCYMPEKVKAALANRPPESKCLVTCIARLSPEKHVENFVKFVEANQDLFKQHDWIPFLAGSKADQEYANKIEESLLEAASNSIIMESFLTPKALCAVLSRAVINVHPCEYDAFGMTVCEAAAMGVPSLVESNGNVGASAIVGDGASIEIDISQGQYRSDTLTSMLNDEQALKRIGEEAKKRALTWDEAAYGRKLLEYLNAVR